MSAQDRAIDLILLACQALDFLYFPGRYLSGSRFNHFRRREYGRSLDYLRTKGFVETRRDATGWICALTAAGRARLSRGVDPAERWARRWDGRWRQVIFDIPVRQKGLRVKLLRWLRANRFGYLQDSVWVTPDPLDLSHSAFRNLHVMADMAVFMESRVVAASSNRAVVASSWDLGRMTKAYARHARFLSAARAGPPSTPSELGKTLCEEDRLWHAALGADPLLPKVLWPEPYPGVGALAARRRFFEFLQEQASALA